LSKTLTLHALPDENSAEVGELKLTAPYYVIQSSKGWSRVLTHGVTPSMSRFGYDDQSTESRRDYIRWVRLGDLSRLDTFNELSGVICCAQGLVQFSTNNYGAAAETFKKYLEKFGSRQDSPNQAVARTLIGYSIMKRSGDLGLSLKEFEAAKGLLPNSSSPVNCMVLALFEKALRSAATKEEMRQLEKDLIRVIQLDSDINAIRNLESLYRLPDAQEYFKNTSGDFLHSRERQLRFLQDVERRVQQQRNS
jgi:hypothetical protein